MRPPLSLAIPLALSVPALLGCGDRTEWGQVVGEVSLDGRPVRQGTIDFFPRDGKGPTAGASIVDGRYDVRVPAGPKRVEISAPQIVGERPGDPDVPGSPHIDVVEESIPDRYNAESELTCVVLPGDNRGESYDFELKSR